MNFVEGHGSTTGTVTHLYTGHGGKAQWQDDRSHGDYPGTWNVSGLMRSKFSSISHPPSYFVGSHRAAVSHPLSTLQEVAKGQFLIYLPISSEAGDFLLYPLRVQLQVIQLLSCSMESVPALQWPATCEVCHLAPSVSYHPVECGKLAPYWFGLYISSNTVSVHLGALGHYRLNVYTWDKPNEQQYFTVASMKKSSLGAPR